MNRFDALARELFSSMDQHKKRPPHADMSAAMRGEMAVMRLLMHDGGEVSAGEISRRLDMTTPRIAAVLGALEKKGLLIRTADEADRRRVLVRLTEAGRALSEEKKQHAIDDMAAMLAYLGEEDAEHFVRIVRRIHQWTPPCAAQPCDREGMD